MTDLLETELSKHVWYTTSNRYGKGPFVICKCTAHLVDSNAHIAHVARVARNAMAEMAAA